jgi:hypothetical protein
MKEPDHRQKLLSAFPQFFQAVLPDNVFHAALPLLAEFALGNPEFVWTKQTVFELTRRIEDASPDGPPEFYSAWFRLLGWRE